MTELARRAEVIAYQKDQLQEAKAKAQLEITYEKKKCENHLEQVRERCYIAEQDMRRELDVSNNSVFFIPSIVHLFIRHWKIVMKTNRNVIRKRKISFGVLSKYCLDFLCFLTGQFSGFN